MSLAAIRRQYGVPAMRGARVTFDGREGRITSAFRGRLRVCFDGETRSRIIHPTWEVTYHLDQAAPS